MLFDGQLWWLPKIRESDCATSYVVGTALGIVLLFVLLGYVQHRITLVEK